MDLPEDNRNQNGLRTSYRHLESNSQCDSHSCTNTHSEGGPKCTDTTLQRTEYQKRSKEKRRHHDETNKGDYVNKRRKRARKRQKKDVYSLADAIRSCAYNLVQDLTFDEFQDKAIENGCLTDEECRAISDIGDRKKQVRKVVLVMTKRSFETMSSFLNALKPAYPYLTENIWHQYEKNVMERPKRLIHTRMCTLCIMKGSVDVETVVDKLYGEKVIDDPLYDQINSSRREVGRQNRLWNAVLKACVESHGIELLLDSLEITGHYTHITKRLRSVFRNNRNMKQFCTCSKHILDKRLAKFRTLSLDSASSHSPRDSSDSVSSTDSDMKNKSDAENVMPVENVISATIYANKTSFDLEQSKNTKDVAFFDPLLNCNNSMTCNAGEALQEKKENSKYESSVQPEIKENLAITKEQHARHRNTYERSLPNSLRQRNHVPDKHQNTRGSGRFRSIVSSAMVQLRVLRQFMKKDTNTKEPLGSTISPVSEIMCETEL